MNPDHPYRREGEQLVKDCIDQWNRFPSVYPEARAKSFMGYQGYQVSCLFEWKQAWAHFQDVRRDLVEKVAREKQEHLDAVAQLKKLEVKANSAKAKEVANSVKQTYIDVPTPSVFQSADWQSLAASHASASSSGSPKAKATAQPASKRPTLESHPEYKDPTYAIDGPVAAQQRRDGIRPPKPERPTPDPDKIEDESPGGSHSSWSMVETTEEDKKEHAMMERMAKMSVDGGMDASQQPVASPAQGPAVKQESPVADQAQASPVAG